MVVIRSCWIFAALKLLTCLLKKFSGIIDFTGSDLAEGQLGNGLCKAMYSGIFHRSRSFHPKRLSCLQVFSVDVGPLGVQFITHRVATLVEERHGEVW